MLKAIKSSYHDVSTIRINNAHTETFPITSGVKQDCNLSPTLFSIYLNDLAKNMKASGSDVHIDSDVFGVFLYAADVVLMAETESDLQKLQ